MNIERLISSEFLSTHWFGRKLLPALTIASVTAALVLVFLIVPNERVMGPVQRIFYFHLGAALATYLVVGLMFLSGCLYLVKRTWHWDAISVAAAPVGFAFCTAVLITGSIWGHSAWNTWWRWEPRLVSVLVMWLMLFAFITLRELLAEGERAETFRAVVAILIAINVPIVMFSVKLLDHSQQLHPEVVAKQGLTDSRYVITLITSIVAMISFSIWTYWLRLTTEVQERELREFKIMNRQRRRAANG